jgi:hypothetical protein
MKAWALWLWDWAKRIFGRSKIIFLQVVGIIATGWVELADPLAMFDWDSVVDKHELAIAIQIGIQVVTALLRAFASNAPASFKPLPMSETPVQTSDEEYPSPKAN